MTVSSMIKQITSQERLGDLQRAVQEVLVDALLGMNGSPAPRIKALVSESLSQPIQEVLSIAKLGILREAYTDVLVYKTPLDKAAEDAGVPLIDLVWLVGQCPIETVDVYDFKPSKNLRQKRES